MNIFIVIPARFNSTRFPGKPLHKIAGKTLLERVLTVAYTAAKQVLNCQVLVATDDKRIAEHVDAIGARFVMTPSSCASGSDRVLAALDLINEQPDLVINFQGDTPLTPAHFLTALVNEYHNHPDDNIFTPVHRLSWSQLDELRQTKQSTPFSGTSVVFDQQLNAKWFSKQILPAIRNEAQLRATSKLSPVYQHIGIYAYTYPMLSTFVKLAQTPYELNEGLEQLRFLENGYQIRVVEVRYLQQMTSIGVDTPQDAQRVENLITKHGEIV